MSRYVRQLLFAFIAFSFTFNVHASILTTLNGTNYEWLDFLDTQNISSSAIKLRLADSTDPFFGYEYASRALFEDLLLSYAPWDGLDGVHSASAVTTGLSQFKSDFGALAVTAPNPPGNPPLPTVDGGAVEFSAFSQFSGMYGSPAECGAAFQMCLSTFDLFFFGGDTVAATQESAGGWDSTHPNPFLYSDPLGGSPYIGSFLVREVSPIPIPAAVWLFGTALIGLVGFSKRRKAI